VKKKGKKANANELLRHVKITPQKKKDKKREAKYEFLLAKYTVNCWYAIIHPARPLPLCF